MQTAMSALRIVIALLSAMMGAAVALYVVTNTTGAAMLAGAALAARASWLWTGAARRRLDK